MKKKGFTLIELLVVIAIIAMLLAILMPALGKVKKMAQRLVCGTNLKGMANAMNVYAFDYRDEFPVAGGTGDGVWSDTTENWNDPAAANKDAVTISASLYMLVREADVGPKSFVCRGGDEQPFQIPSNIELDMTELWDFGNGVNSESAADNSDGQTPGNCQSYSYQIPYNVVGNNYPADGTMNPANAVMADRSPYFDNSLNDGGSDPTAIDADSYLEVVCLIDPEAALPHYLKIGNSAAHDREGQNVLFGDGHVSFEKRPDVANRYDNVYNPFIGKPTWDEDDRRIGENKYHQVNKTKAKSAEDTVLVNDFWEP